MSIGGAMNSAVSGITSQGAKIGIISDNISNLNTVGYKRNEAIFSTLINDTAGTLQYNPGGVKPGKIQQVEQQGLLQSTDSATDVAISGAGMMVVNTEADGSGTVYYTRAGQYRQDALGNFVSPNGYFLQGWPLDANGLLPGQPGNLNTTSKEELSSLETINLQTSSGSATASTSVSMGANLDASQVQYPGAGGTIDWVATENASNAQDDVIIPNASLALADTFTVVNQDGLSYTFEYGGVEDSADVTLGIGAATTVSQPFYLAGAQPSGADATFTITTTTTGTITFTYRQSSPNPVFQQFNSMNTLAAAINEVNGLNARIYNGIMYVAPDNANEAMTFANGGAADWIGAGFLDLTDTVAAGINPRFASLSDLADKVNNLDGIAAEISSPLADTELTIRTTDPEGTITFSDGTGDATLIEMGVIANVGDSKVFGPVYDQGNSIAGASNMASGDIQPHFTRNVRVYDSLGTGHNLTVAFLKLDTNEWGIEIYAAEDGDITTSLVDDQVAVGRITFNGDGTPASITQGLLLPATVEWTNGAEPSEVTFDWGTAGQPFGTEGALVYGLTDGITQFDSDYNVAFVNQNGAPVGELVGVQIDSDGFVIANYSNGEIQRLYKLPVAEFANPNGLQAVSGNVFADTDEAGEVNLRNAGTNGVGTYIAGALEQSNVELAKELTDMIVAQRAYQANTKVISTSDELLQELNQL